MPQSKLVGVDVGGTFTDLVILDEASGEVAIAKVPTTPTNQADGVLAALHEAGGVVPAGIGVLIHGTTTATNALLERKGAVTGLITTRGFRDVLELGRRTRPKAYGLTGSFEPLIPRDLRLEIAERIDAEGEEVLALDEGELRAAVDVLRRRGAEAVVIHFMHAYVNDRHERRAREIVEAAWPNRYVTAGSELVAEYREYERGTTAAINAFVQPVIDRYLSRLSDELRRRGCVREPLIMQGNGGTMSVDTAVRQAVNTLMSGPAAGVKAAAYTALAAGYPNVITCDMGGTSFDVAVIRNGRPEVTADKEMGYALPVRVPMIDIHTIGAGGGSIARVDTAGILRIGPESAGAHPGPICYGRGGEEPTTTDANLLLGRLNPRGLLGVKGPVDPARVRELMDAKLGAHLGLAPDDIASAILRVANDKMAGAIRMVSLERGYDPRDFVLFAFGGAGPLHAVALARELAIPKVLVPARPGITSALGCLVADVRHDFVKTINQDLLRMDVEEVHRVLRAQIDEGRRLLATEGVDVEAVSVFHEADMQYVGQSHVLSVPIPRTEFARNEILLAFERAYWERFEVELREMRCLVVNVRTTVIGHRRPVPLDGLAGGQTTSRPAPDHRRRVWFDGEWFDTPVYRREQLSPGAEVVGPAIIEQLDATTVIEPGDGLSVDRFGNLAIAVRPAQAQRMPAGARVDPVTLVVVQNGLQQIASEMDLTQQRASFSPVIAEAFDRSNGIYARDNGEVIAQGELGLPIFVGVMQFTTRAAIEHVKDFHPGDIVIVNDPYFGGTHLMDVKMVKPFFYRGRLWCFLSNTGHWPDTGGAVPGGFSARATEVQQEGLRLPPVKLYRDGVLQDDILSIILANIRVPEERIGDIKAHVAALSVGERRLTALLDRYGEDTVSACIAELRRRSEQMMRAHIAKIPDGVYASEAFLDSDGVDDAPLAIRLRLKKEGTDLHFDFSESSPPCRGPLNSVLATTLAAVYLAVKHVFPAVPINAGCFEPLHIPPPHGTFLYAKYPRPVSGCAAEVSSRVAESVFLALARAIPEQLFAAPFGTAGNITLGGYDPLKERHYIMYFFSGGGYGGSFEGDGLTNGVTTIGISKTQPIEILEQRYPILYERYAIREGSAGPGRARGGFGIDYRILVRRGELLLSFLMDHARFGPPGILGGRDGGKTEVRIHRGDGVYVSPHVSKDQDIRLTPGDAVDVKTPGGGGYGQPLERDPALVLRDVLRGYYSIEDAARQYAVVLRGDPPTIDRPATDRLRAGRRG